jgi:putative colanic acid biosynthesis UDP-glucose lipid carrier transferase
MSLGTEGSRTIAPPAGGAARDAERWSRKVAADLVAFSDVAAIASGAMLSTAVHGSLGLLTRADLPGALQLSLLIAVGAHFIFRQLGDYEDGQVSALRCDLSRIVGVLFVAVSAIVSVAFTLGATADMPRSWFAGAFAGAAPCLVLTRMAALRILARAAARGSLETSIAVYGAGRIAIKLSEHLKRAGKGVRLAGIYDDRQDPQRAEVQSLVVGGRLADLITAGRSGAIDEIIIALPQSAERRIADVVRRLEHLPLRIRIVTHIASDLVDVTPGRHHVSSIGPLGLLDVKSKPLKDWAPHIKRFEDVVVAGLALAFAWPLFLLIAAAIRLDSPGPVLFRQRRHGLNHQEIEVLKFRTMHVLEEGAAVRQATRDDPRVTRVGRILRKTSLDELPQLWNVLMGDMSLVGPRPHAIVHNEYYGEMLERYANRHQAKPGITGWAQVNGFRGETRTADEMRSRVEHDLHYIDNWSLWLDIKIMIMTPRYGLSHANAY